MTALAPDARLGRYHLVRELGRGGAGVVWEAERDGPGRDRRVALKVLHSATDGLRREARLGGLLRHRHLVEVYEVGEHDGTWFCAMALCDGTLAGRPPLPLSAVVEVGLAVCEALAYAHRELGLVHLDLKPANLLLHDGVVKVGDLGIAHATGFAPRRGGHGTVGYMAPEQAARKPLDARADLHALGVTLVELATGRMPGAELTLPAGNTTTAFGRAAPSDLAGAGLAGPLGRVAARCTAADPDDRYPDADALAAALRALPVRGPSLRAALGLPPPRPRSGWDDTYVGRAGELRALEAALATPGLVTIKGPPGIGKTRLAAELSDGRPTIRIAAGPIPDTDALLAAIADALGAHDSPEGAEAVAAQLARLGSLLVLDELDRHEASAPMLARLLAAAPEARVLATSTGRLGVPGERVLELGPLPELDAIALLRERAAERGVEGCTDAGLAALARRLDGIPLALELAAGRLGVLSVDEVLERLGLSLLRTGSDGARGALELALDAAWAGLDERTRAGLARLSVFVGGCTPEGAAAVGVGPDVLGELVARSLAWSSGARYVLPSTVREHAGARLGAEVEGALRAHGAWCAAIPMTAALLDPELEDIVAANGRALARGDVAVAIETLRRARHVLVRRGPLERLAALVAAARDLPTSPTQQATLLHVVAGLHQARRELPELLAVLKRSLALHRASGDRRGEVRTLVNLGSTARGLGRLADAERWLREVLDRFDDETGRDALVPTLSALGRVANALGRPAEDLARQEEAHARWTATGSPPESASFLTNYAQSLIACGQLAPARRILAQAEGIAHDRADPTRFAQSLVVRADLARVLGHHDEARTLYERAFRAWTESGSRQNMPSVEVNVAMLAGYAGDWPRACAGLEAIRGATRNDPVVLESVELLLGWALLEADRGAEARPWLERQPSDQGETPQLAKLALAELERREGRPERAATLLRELDQPHARWRVFVRIGWLLAHAAVSRDLGQPDAARAALDEARGRLDELGASPDADAARRLRALAGSLG